MNDDLISRQAAIDAVKRHTFRLTFAEEQNCEGHVAWSADAVYSDVIEWALSDLPSAEPTQTNASNTLNALDCVDTISRAKAIDEMARFNGYLDDDMITRLQIAIKKLPSAEPQIVRCGECKRRRGGETD